MARAHVCLFVITLPSPSSFIPKGVQPSHNRRAGANDWAGPAGAGAGAGAGASAGAGAGAGAGSGAFSLDYGSGNGGADYGAAADRWHNQEGHPIASQIPTSMLERPQSARGGREPPPESMRDLMAKLKAEEVLSRNGADDALVAAFIATDRAWFLASKTARIVNKLRAFWVLSFEVRYRRTPACVSLEKPL